MVKRRACFNAYGRVCALFGGYHRVSEKGREYACRAVRRYAERCRAAGQTELDGQSVFLFLCPEHGHLAERVAGVFRGGLYRRAFAALRLRQNGAVRRTGHTVRQGGRGGNRRRV